MKKKTPPPWMRDVVAKATKGIKPKTKAKSKKSC
jgi:hypothetical protein